MTSGPTDVVRKVLNWNLFRVRVWEEFRWRVVWVQWDFVIAGADHGDCPDVMNLFELPPFISFIARG